MARIILKSRYLRAGSKQHSEHLIQYIAKREGVQKIDDTWKHQPATKEQRKLIGELLRDFPEVKDSFEYADYLAKSNKGTASELISRAIDDNVDLIGKRENYVLYIAKRPRAEQHGTHVYLPMRMYRSTILKWRRRSQITTAMCGRISFLCVGRMRPALATTTPMLGETSCALKLKPLRRT